MSESAREIIAEVIKSELAALEARLLNTHKEAAGIISREISLAQGCVYAQLESLSWLQRRLSIDGQLPPLRGWAASPDVLLRLHTHILTTRPELVVEFGSGASTLVIADALRQNKCGKLISIEHSLHYGSQTQAMLDNECLQNWVDLRMGELEPWVGLHMNDGATEKPSLWYPASLLNGVARVDLVWVDGPPAVTCPFSRYPALPALSESLAPQAEVWMDDTIRQEERDICARWAEDHGFVVEYYPLEKGLGRLTRDGG